MFKSCSELTKTFVLRPWIMWSCIQLLKGNRIYGYEFWGIIHSRRSGTQMINRRSSVDANRKWFMSVFATEFRSLQATCSLSISHVWRSDVADTCGRTYYLSKEALSLIVNAAGWLHNERCNSSLLPRLTYNVNNNATGKWVLLYYSAFIVRHRVYDLRRDFNHKTRCYATPYSQGQ